MAGTTAEAAKAPQEGESHDAKAAKAPGGGGIASFLPLIIAIVTMPVLAFVTTNFLILPKIKAAIGQASASAAPASGAEDSVKDTTKDSASKDGASKEGSSKDGAKPGKAKVTYQMSKILVNVAGTMGTRYLMTSLTLVGNNPDLKTKADEDKDQLLDLATTTLSSKTIADLEKPGSRNIIRSELMTVFNNALGAPLIQEIYITEMAIQ